MYMPDVGDGGVVGRAAPHGALLFPMLVSTTTSHAANGEFERENALGIEVLSYAVEFSRDRAPRSAKSYGLGPPSFMCGVHYGRVLAVLGNEKTRESDFPWESAYYIQATVVHPPPPMIPRQAVGWPSTVRSDEWPAWFFLLVFWVMMMN